MNGAGFPDYDLNGLITFNSGTADSFGTYWYMDGEMAGWDSPDGRVTMLTKIGIGPSADGEIPADEHYRGRTISFKLVSSSPSEAARENSRLLLAETLDLVGTTGTLTVNEEVPKFVTISRSGNSNQGKLVMTEQGLSGKAVSTPGFPTATPDSDGLIYVLETTIEVYCADPRKYAVTPIVAPLTSVIGGQWGIAYDNPGNTQTQNLQINMTAPAAGSIRCVEGGVTVIGGLDLAIPTTPGPALPGFPGTLIVDAAAKTILDGGGNNYYYLRSLVGAPPWLAIGPGGGFVVFTGPLFGVSGSLTYYPAWI